MVELITRPDGAVELLKVGRTVPLLPRVPKPCDSLCVSVLASDEDAASLILCVDVRDSGLALIKRCLSSGSSSASDSSSAPNASVRAVSASLLCDGSSCSSRLDEGEDEREWNDGGGDDGMAAFSRE